MRNSGAKAAESRRRIIETAGHLFRERGLDGVGLAEIMKCAGLTHGGFYGHFKSKQDLQREVGLALVEEVERDWRRVIDRSPKQPLAALLDHYLSWPIVDNPRDTCIFVALIEDISRSEPALRAIFDKGLSRLADLLGEILPGGSIHERRQQGMAVLSAMIGAASLARAVSDRALAGDLLASARSRLLS